MPRLSVCQDPSTVLAEAPCSQCYSISELKRFLMIALGWFEFYDFPEDMDRLISDSACWVCTSEKQKLEALVITMGQFVFEIDPDQATLRELMSCTRCMSDAQVDAAIAYLWCLFWQPLD